MKKSVFLFVVFAIIISVFVIGRHYSNLRARKQSSLPVTTEKKVVSVASVHSRQLPTENIPPTITDSEQAVIVDNSSNEENVSSNASSAVAGDIIPDEHILSFYSKADRDNYIRLAESLGGVVLDRLKVGNSIRLRANKETMRKLAEVAPMPVDSGNNFVMRNPVLPIINPEKPDGRYAVFGDKVLDWLGIHGNNDKWGAGIKIAVLDTGINDHIALKHSNIERMDLLGGNGYDPDNKVAHGTAVTSLITGNGDDVHGIAPSAEILGIRVIGPDGKGDSFTVAKGIIAAVDNGADIINLSMGSRSDSFILQDAVNYATEHGVVIVAAAGNDASEGISFPAAYDNVIAVPAVDATGRHLYFSNRGPAADISAPGYGITAAGQDNKTELFSGTSAAAPLISGAIAAVMSTDPSLTAADAEEIIKEYSDDGGKPGPDDEYGVGHIDMDRVLNRDKSGIYDIAVNSPWMVKGDGEGAGIIASMQNRGTEDIESAKLIVNIDGARYSTYFNDIKEGQTVSDTFAIPSSSLEADGDIQVEVSAILLNHSDARPYNNYMRISVFYKR